MWSIELTDEAVRWLEGLTQKERSSIAAAITLLEELGPQLGRPAVDSIKGSRHSNMKELRSFGGHLRALFCFDPQRTAIILLGGDKSNDWSGWYVRNIPIADEMYDEYLKGLRENGML